MQEPLSIELTPEQLNKAREEAKKLNISLEDYLARIVNNYFKPDLN